MVTLFPFFLVSSGLALVLMTLEGAVYVYLCLYELMFSFRLIQLSYHLVFDSALQHTLTGQNHCIHLYMCVPVCDVSIFSYLMSFLLQRKSGVHYFYLLESRSPYIAI